MNPLSTSSLNTERTRLDAARPNATASDAGAGSGFAQLLQGAREPVDAPAPTQQAAEAPKDGETSGDEVKDADKTETTAADRRETGPTLAHWLLNGGQPAADAAAQAAVSLPPAQQAGVATDDLKAAAMARQVLDAVRQRAKGAGKGEGAGAATGPLGTDAAARRELAGGAPKGIDTTTVAAADAVKDTGKAAHGDSRFADALSQVQGMPQAGAAAAPLPSIAEASAPPPAERVIATPVQDPGFGTAVGVSISRLAKEGVHEARLQLNPAELGPLSVHIEMQGREARVSLGAAHAETRALLDASLPALTEAFRADGLVLAASQVSDMGPDQQAFSGQAGQDAGQGRSDGWAQAREGSAGGAGSGQRGQGGSEPGRNAAVRSSSEITLPLPGAARSGRGALGGLDLYA